MPIVRYSAEEVRRKAKVRRRVIAATSEAKIARQAARDGTATGTIDSVKALEEGRARVVMPLDVAKIPKP